jgi:hypothetical protein
MASREKSGGKSDRGFDEREEKDSADPDDEREQHEETKE